MLLTLEDGVLRNLHRRLHIDLPGMDLSEQTRRALVLDPAHTVFPEAAVEGLPDTARAELTAGLTGPLRHAIADADPSDSALPGQRDQLLDHLTGDHGRLGAITLADRVHLARLVRGDVPPILAVGCLLWYGAYRTDHDPNTAVLRALFELRDTWLNRPQDRPDLDKAMSDHATSATTPRTPSPSPSEQPEHRRRR